MYKGKTVSLIFPAFNEEDNIFEAVAEFKKTNLFDEIIVVDNNSKDQTANLAKEAGAKVVKQQLQGYGFALQKGLAVAKGQLIMLAEPDGTFSAKDCKRLLQYLKNLDCVFGTRTNTDYIRPGANMKFALRTGNVLLAKLMQILYGMPPISDCGCTFRVFKKAVVQELLPHLTVGGSHFLPQTVLLTHLLGFQFREIPVRYQKRVGISKITGTLSRSVSVGSAMLNMIIQYRFSSPVQPSIVKK